ncbi:MAG: right-handed parallel beta-helix repeat-containing protein, partial [bacterium]|nr:right-handed parallel beta-helix repeat-containing protein [bacterium]
MRRLMEIIACLVLIAAWQAAIGGTWYVDDSVASPGDGTSWQTAFRTIQEGINAASHGDTVLVAAGTYVENIKFNGKNITLTSTEPLNPTVVQNTIIDGNKKASVVTFSGTEDETCILSGFTIRNGTGTATPYGKAGGGIYGGTAYYPTYATVENNIITSNSVDATGGGLSYCDGTVRNNKVTANYADSGGGLSDCNGTIQNNTVTGNSATSGGGGFYNCGGTIDNNTISDNSGRYGGGLQDCGGRIENNTISDNSGGDGGGLDNCDGTIQNNSITGNEAVTWGGGLRACDGTIRENTIARNTAQGGGGLDNCQGTIENNTVTSNSATSGGGGFYNCGGTIENNTITGNSASTGGGLCSCSGTIEDNTITDNEAGIGGGLSVCRGTMQNNSVSQNKAAEDGGGLQGCSGTIQNNVISGNSAGRDGGGLVGCGGAIQNNVIVGNSAGHWGGGLYECHGNIQNNTVVGNSAATGAGLYACDGAIRNCIVWGNTGQRYPQLCKCNEPSYSCIQGWTGGGEGNISDDPKFVDAAAGDYHVQAESPCIDRGINYYWFAWPQQDLDGNCRLVGERVDMGCYEYGSSADSDGDLLSDDEEETLETYADLDDCDYDGLRDGLEILRGTDPLDGWDPSPTVVRVPSDTPGIQRALCLAVDGDEVILEPGTYDANLVFCGANAILRSSQPENREMVASTIIDGGSRGSVVSLTGNESAECVISGLTIQNGRAGYGGGICGGTSAHSHATIKNNVITRNSAVRGGGGMASCDGYIQNNVITTNSAAYGGGLSQCHGTIESNIISGNSSGDYGGGGVAFCEGTIR